MSILSAIEVREPNGLRYTVIWCDAVAFRESLNFLFGILYQEEPNSPSVPSIELALRDGYAAP